MQPSISIAMCTYNGSRFLAQQLDSLLAQDYGDFEIVVCDDASSDATFALLTDYAQRDSRLRIHRNPVNLGFLRNFERVFSLCEGRFIAPCDQDDLWLREKLSVLHNAIGDAAMVYCDSELIDADGRLLGRRMSDLQLMLTTSDPAALVFQNCVSGHAALFRRELLVQALPFPDDVFHDWWLAFIAAGNGGVRHVDRPLVRYRQHNATFTDVEGTRSIARAQRPRGFRVAELRQFGRWLDIAAARGPAGVRPLLTALAALWHDRESRWFCPGLAALLLRHRHRLFALQRDSRGRHLRRALRFFPGLRLKRILQAHDYG